MSPFVRGAVLAAVTVVVAVFLPAGLVAPLLALLLAFAAAVYVGFAEADPAGGERRLQWVVALIFVGIALLGLWITPWILALGWLLHAGWDLLHDRGVLTTRTAGWYPGACLAYDLIVAAFVAYWTWGGG